MKDLLPLLDISDLLDQAGLQKEADQVDTYVENFLKNAKQGVAKCGLKETSIEKHLTLFEGYKKALEHYTSEYKKVSISNNEKNSPNYGRLREITSNYAHNYNSVHFHELYLADVINNNPYPLEKDSQMKDLMKKLYGESSKFETELKRLAEIPRNGWVLFCYNTAEKNLCFNVIDLHEEHLIANHIPILALDMWEHAYLDDFGLDKEVYANWFLERIDWRNPRKRLKNLLRLK